MRKLDVTDFEASNIEYIEFWMMDPFVYKKTAKGGDLYFDLGEISEDIFGLMEKVSDIWRKV